MPTSALPPRDHPRSPTPPTPTFAPTFDFNPPFPSRTSELLHSHHHHHHPRLVRTVLNLVNTQPTSIEPIWQEAWVNVLNEIGSNNPANADFTTSIHGNTLDIRDFGSSLLKTPPDVEIHRLVVDEIVRSRKRKRETSIASNSGSQETVSVCDDDDNVTLVSTPTELLRNGVVKPDVSVTIRSKLQGRGLTNGRHLAALTGELKASGGVNSRLKALHQACMSKAIIYALEAFELCGTSLGIAMVDYTSTRLLVIDSRTILVETKEEHTTGSPIPIKKYLEQTDFQQTFAHSWVLPGSVGKVPNCTAGDIDWNAVKTVLDYFVVAVDSLKDTKPAFALQSLPLCSNLEIRNIERVQWQHDADVAALAGHARPDILAKVEPIKVGSASTASGLQASEIRTGSGRSNSHDVKPTLHNGTPPVEVGQDSATSYISPQNEAEGVRETDPTQSTPRKMTDSTGSCRPKTTRKRCDQDDDEADDGEAEGRDRVTRIGDQRTGGARVAETCSQASGDQRQPAEREQRDAEQPADDDDVDFADIWGQDHLVVELACFIPALSRLPVQVAQVCRD